MGKLRGLCHLNWNTRFLQSLLLTSRCVIILFLITVSPGTFTIVFTRKGRPCRESGQSYFVWMACLLVIVETERWVTESELRIPHETGIL